MPAQTCCDDCITRLAVQRLLRPEVQEALGGKNPLLCEPCMAVRLGRFVVETDFLHPKH